MLHSLQRGLNSKRPTLVFFLVLTKPLKSYEVSQSVQSARLSVQSSELSPITVHPQDNVAPLWVQGGRHTRLQGKGLGDLIPTMGQTLWYSRYTIIPERG